MRSLVGSVGPGMAPGIALSRKSTGRSLPELTNVLRFNRYQQVQVHVSKNFQDLKKAFAQPVLVLILNLVRFHVYTYRNTSSNTRSNSYLILLDLP